MYDVATAIDRLPPGTVVARVAELEGFGSRHRGEAVAVAPDGSVVAGRILAGLADQALADHVRAGHGAGTIDVGINDLDAADAGLACGGQARLLVQGIDSIDATGWNAVAQRRPVVLVSDLSSGATLVATDDGGRAGTFTAAAEQTAQRLLRGGRSTSELDATTLAESYLPPTTVRIVGHAGVGVAVAAQAELLGWVTETVDGSSPAVATANAMSSHDALVVLSHDPDVDTPCLIAALAHGRGYVGALGSRLTQQARRDRLGAAGFTTDQLERIHGPVGLDLGARTPAETAVAIVAEIIAYRSGRVPTSLAATDGPING